MKIFVNSSEKERSYRRERLIKLYLYNLKLSSLPWKLYSRMEQDIRLRGSKVIIVSVNVLFFWFWLFRFTKNVQFKDLFGVIMEADVEISDLVFMTGSTIEC